MQVYFQVAKNLFEVAGIHLQVFEIYLKVLRNHLEVNKNLFEVVGTHLELIENYLKVLGNHLEVVQTQLE